MIFFNGNIIGGELTWGLLFLSVLISIILLIRKTKFILLNSFFDKILNVIITVFFISIFILSILIIFKNSQSYDLNNFVNLEGFGFAGLFSLMLLPLCWQFVDLTNWQRLLSVKMPESNSRINQDIKKGLLNFAIESPFTWILFIVFGLLITASLPSWSFEDILIDLPKQLINSNIFIEQILGYTFIVSIISIMLSTIDSFIMGISFTYAYDINPHSRKLIEEKREIDVATTKQILNKGKYFSFLAVIIALGLFILFDQNIKGGGELFINLLLTFYSATLSFLPLIIGMIFLKKKPNSTWALASMLIGATAGISIGVYATLYNPVFAWYPIIVSFALSFIIYGLGYIINKECQI